jgi:hypothetical protein
MKVLLTILFVLSAFAAFSQIVIDRYDMPASGDEFDVAVKNFYSGNFTQTGQDYLWDFSLITSSYTKVDSFISIFSTNIAYNIIFNPFVANMAYLTPSMPGWIPGITIEDNFDFYYNTTDRYEKAGFGAVINGIPTPIRYTSAEKWFNYPLTYGQASSSSSYWGMPIPGIGYFGQTITRSNQADGWGTLVMPYGIFEVIRVKSVINTKDTVYYDDQQFGFTSNRPEIREYRWIAKGEGMPVLTLRDEGLFSKTAYYKIIPSVHISTGEKSPAVNVYPNPCNDLLYIKSNGEQIQLVTLYSISGCEVLQQNGDSESAVVSVEHLPAGSYIVKVRTDQNCIRSNVVLTGNR